MTIREALQQTVLCHDPLDTRTITKLAEVIIKRQGNDSEQFGVQFALYPLWAVEKAELLILTMIVTDVLGEQALPYTATLTAADAERILGRLETLLMKGDKDNGRQS